MRGKRREVAALFDAYWTGPGWRPGRPTTAAIEHAIASGVMWRDVSVADHDEVVNGVRRAASGTSPSEVAAAFMASLTSRRLDLRSALSSLIIGSRLPAHAFVPGAELTYLCAVCGLSDGAIEIDRNRLNYERFKLGGLRHDDPTYVWLDLELFAVADRPVPGEADRAAMAALLDLLEALPAGTTATKAAGRPWAGIPANKDEREAVLDVLGICSVLETPEHRGHLTGFVPTADRADPPWRYVERAYPVNWWRSEDGVNRDAARQLGLLPGTPGD